MNPISNITKIRREIYKKIVNWALEKPLPVEATDEDVELLTEQLVSDLPQSGFPEQEKSVMKLRVRFAMGKDIEQVVNAIPDACNSCMFDKTKYVVTELCQNCTAKLCQNSCPKKGITIVDGRARIAEVCVGCGQCAKNCPYGAIVQAVRPCENECAVGAVQFDESKKVVIDGEKCVSCGACVVACPFGAITDAVQIVDVIRAIRLKEVPVVAMPAPALAGQYGPKTTPGQLKAALLKMGFDDVVEVALGADIVTKEEAEEAKERYSEKIMTNSCCPAYLMAVKAKLPKLAHTISHTHSPMRVTGKLVKERYDGKVITVFVGPCISKKAEMTWGNEADYVLTFEEVAAVFEVMGIDPAKETPVEMKDATHLGRMFARTGGVIGAVAEVLDVSKHPVKILHPTKLKNCLTTLRTEATKAMKGEGFTFVEGMACPSGCISGPGVVAPVTMASRALDKYIADGRSNVLEKAE
ncbi:4Fe-4S binding protein [Peptococcaceae bacterium]|nr:4Fe-4S binding protein [Peptococcaceae bacterium]